MSATRVLVHTSLQAIRWGDMDAFGHVNNTVYFRYMEQARIEWFYQLAGAVGATHIGNCGPLIVSANCTFKVPLEYPGDISVRMRLGDPGRTSIGSFYDLQREGTTVAEGAATIVWVDLDTRRPVPLPAALTVLFPPTA